jgi:hypothetical protein
MSKQTGSANFTATTGLQAQHRMRRSERNLPRLLSRPSTANPRTGLDHAVLVSILDEALAIGASFLAYPATTATTAISTTTVTKPPTAPSTPDTDRDDQVADENDESSTANL